MRFKPRFFIILAVLILLMIFGITRCTKKSASDTSAAESAAEETEASSEDNASSVGSDQQNEGTAEDAADPESSESETVTYLSADGEAGPDTTTPESAYPLSQPDDDILVLVNKTYHVTEEYVPDDMVTVSTVVEGVGNSETKKMRKVAAEALENLIAGAADEGYQIAMRTGYRSYDYQKTLFANYAAKNGEEAANCYSARPGESEHQTGLCCDVSSPSVSWALSYSYGETDEGKWLAENCYRYGFILRYKQDKTDITGYVYEPWHIRYVGEEAAAIIYENDITLEEYLGRF